MLVSFACSQRALRPRAQVTLSAPCPELRHVEKLHDKIWLKYSKALESLEFERAEGPLVSEDIPAQSISKRQTAYLCLIFSHKLIHGQNRRCTGN